MRRDPPPEFFDDEYAALELGAGLPVLSLACFGAALGARFLVSLLPVEVLGYPWRILLPALAVPALSALGLLLALLGLRNRKTHGLARVGVFVNTVALVLSGLFAWAFFYILPG